MAAPLTQRIGRIVAGISTLAVSGCFSLEAKPFTLAIPAEQLRISADLAPSLDHASADLPGSPEDRDVTAWEPRHGEPAIVTQTAPVLVEADPEPRPAVTPASDEPSGSDRIVITARKAAPPRVPDYAPAEMASLICVMQKIGFDDGNARKAHEATLAARDVREAVTRGQATGAQADEIERKRQDAVQRALSPLPFVDLFFSPIVRKKDLPGPAYKGVALEQVGVTTFLERGSNVMAVSGVARNSGKVEVELPPLTLEALDTWDFVLSGQSSLLPFKSLAPGEAKPFEMRLLNPPEHTTDVYVHFAPPFRYRWRRDCDFFDARTSTPDSELTDLPAPVSRSLWGIIDDQLDAYKLAITPVVAGGSTPADYSAAELNTLTRYFRREAAWAWECRESARIECAGAARRLNWRDMFALAEAIDEAWVAVSMHDALQATHSAEMGSSELAAADRVRQTRIREVAALGVSALRRAGSSVPEVDVELTTSLLKLDDAGLYLQIAGRMINTGADTRFVDTLLVALVDRFNLPLSSITVASATALAPGQAQDFSQRIPVTRSGSRPALSASDAGVIGRVPPEEIAWQVRVGAMAQLNETSK